MTIRVVVVLDRTSLRFVGVRAVIPHRPLTTLWAAEAAHGSRMGLSDGRNLGSAALREPLPEACERVLPGAERAAQGEDAEADAGQQQREPDDEAQSESLSAI